MLNTTSKYALRVLVALAASEPDAFASGHMLAATTRIPRNYQSKVLLALGNAGLVEAVRGRGGGYRLARPAREIALIEVAEVFEGFRTHPSCLLGVHEVCSDEAPCSAHASFRDIRARYITFLERTSIADVASMEARSKTRVQP